MPIIDRATFDLDLPETPDWWRDDQMHSLGVRYHGVCKATIWKTSDRQLFVYVEITGWPEMPPIETRLHPPEKLPILLSIGWDAEGVRLRQGVQPPIVVPWPPLRPVPPQ